MDYVKTILEFDRKTVPSEALLLAPNLLSSLLLILYINGFSRIQTSALFASAIIIFLIILRQSESWSTAMPYAILTSLNLLISGLLTF